MKPARAAESHQDKIPGVDPPLHGDQPQGLGDMFIRQGDHAIRRLFRRGQAQFRRQARQGLSGLVAIQRQRPAQAGERGQASQ